MNTGCLAYARAMDVWGNSGRFDVIIPYSRFRKHDGQRRTRRNGSSSGSTTRSSVFSVIFYGAPALSVEEFPSLPAGAPSGRAFRYPRHLGRYDRAKLVNLRNNRWFVEARHRDLPRRRGHSRWSFPQECISSATMTTTSGAITLEQDPVSTTQVHAAYMFRRWRERLRQRDLRLRRPHDNRRRRAKTSVNNSRVGATLGLPVNRNNSIKLYASSSLHTGGDHYDLVGIVGSSTGAVGFNARFGHWLFPTEKGTPDSTGER